jgi:hypothetical protein
VYGPGVINFGGVRIGGVSGIWSGSDFRKGHFEKPPYHGLSELKSAYHVREYDCFRLRQLQQVRAPTHTQEEGAAVESMGGGG